MTSIYFLMFLYLVSIWLKTLSNSFGSGLTSKTVSNSSNSSFNARTALSLFPASVLISVLAGIVEKDLLISCSESFS